MASEARWGLKLECTSSQCRNGCPVGMASEARWGLKPYSHLRTPGQLRVGMASEARWGLKLISHNGSFPFFWLGWPLKPVGVSNHPYHNVFRSYLAVLGWPLKPVGV